MPVGEARALSEARSKEIVRAQIESDIEMRKAAQERAVAYMIQISEAGQFAAQLRVEQTKDAVKLRNALQDLVTDLKKEAEKKGTESAIEMERIARSMSKAVSASLNQGEKVASEKTRDLIEEQKFANTIAGSQLLAKARADKAQGEEVQAKRLLNLKEQNAVVAKRNAALKEDVEAAQGKVVEFTRERFKENAAIDAGKLENFIQTSNEATAKRTERQVQLGFQVEARRQDLMDLTNAAIAKRAQRLEDANLAFDRRQQELKDAADPNKSGGARVEDVLREAKLVAGARAEQLRESGKVTQARFDNLQDVAREIVSNRDSARVAFQEDLKVDRDTAIQEFLDKKREMNDEVEALLEEKRQQVIDRDSKAAEEVRENNLAAEKKAAERREENLQTQNQATEQRLERLKMPKAYEQMLERRRAENEKRVLDMLRERYYGTL